MTAREARSTVSSFSPTGATWSRTPRAAPSPSSPVITQVPRYWEAGQPPAVAAFPPAWNAASSTVTPRASTKGRLVRSVRAGMSFSNPSRAGTSAPEHCAPIDCRSGSSGSRETSRSSATTSRVLTPLPTSRASASVTNSIGRRPVTSMPVRGRRTGRRPAQRRYGRERRRRNQTVAAAPSATSPPPAASVTAP